MRFMNENGDEDFIELKTVGFLDSISFMDQDFYSMKMINSINRVEELGRIRSTEIQSRYS